MDDSLELIKYVDALLATKACPTPFKVGFSRLFFAHLQVWFFSLLIAVSIP